MAETHTPRAILLKNGRVVDPANSVDGPSDVLLQDARIARVFPGIVSAEDVETVDVTGKLVVPGLIDMHVHLRDPGFPEKETVDSGCRAAAAGGFTAVACLPNTNPLTDSPEVVREILASADAADARVYPIACATKGMAGQEIADTGVLRSAGAVAFSDDGVPIESDAIMRELLTRSETFGFPICPHSEALDLTRGGHMHDGAVSRELGLKGTPAEGEAAMVERDIDLVREVGGRLHVLHISVRRAIDLVRKAKAEGLTVTCEACPHHIALIDEDVRVFGTQGKMSPPLRSADDRDAVLEGLADGTIDALATDHAPHTAAEKLRSFPDAPNGILGLETAVSLLFSRLVDTGVLTVPDVISKLTVVPARILGVGGGALTEGDRADVTVIDPDCVWTYDANASKSMSRNTPFHGWTLKGRPIMTILNGRVTHKL